MPSTRSKFTTLCVLLLSHTNMSGKKYAFTSQLR